MFLKAIRLFYFSPSFGDGTTVFSNQLFHPYVASNSYLRFNSVGFFVSSTIALLTISLSTLLLPHLYFLRRYFFFHIHNIRYTSFGLSHFQQLNFYWSRCFLPSGLMLFSTYSRPFGIVSSLAPFLVFPFSTYYEN
ncbi:hypothetical protein CW304_25415 [Bacillus sp. UFRGS-B20]|nr:hypothetical protein CW304_25415 [Bacillus sp. UFRGS-B20]